jgi:MFS superfamily sulfate permease-like transporter
MRKSVSLAGCRIGTRVASFHAVSTQQDPGSAPTIWRPRVERLAVYMATSSVNKAMCDSQELTMVLDARAQCPYLDMSTAPIRHDLFSHGCFVRILPTNVLEVSDASSTQTRGLPSA